MRFINRGTVLTALVALAIMPAALAGAQDRAAVSVYADGVDFQPLVGHSGATLTVSGNGRVFQQKLAAGERLSIGLYDPDGQPLADGVYSWSLELLPGKAAARELRAAAARHGGKAPGAWEAQSGSFAIRGGVIADRALVEAQQRTAASASPSSTMTASSFGPRRLAAADDDAAVGSKAGVEAQVNATARRQLPASARGVLVQPDRVGDDSDAKAATRGGLSLERVAAPTDNQFSAPLRAPQPRSDGSNGRPRSE